MRPSHSPLRIWWYPNTQKHTQRGCTLRSRQYTTDDLRRKIIRGGILYTHKSSPYRQTQTTRTKQENHKHKNTPHMCQPETQPLVPWNTTMSIHGQRYDNTVNRPGQDFVHPTGFPVWTGRRNERPQDTNTNTTNTNARNNTKTQHHPTNHLICLRIQNQRPHLFSYKLAARIDQN